MLPLDYYFKINGTTTSGGTQASGTTTITENGLHDVASYKFANVNVPAPSDYIKPTGTLAIDSNGTHNVREYESVEVNVESSGGGNTLKRILDGTKSAQYLFYNYPYDDLSELIQYNYTENVTNFSDMFDNCKNLTSIPQLDTSNGTKLHYMFYNCENLTTIPQLDTSNGTDFSGMFRSCKNLTSIPQLDTSKGTNFNEMLSGCSSLTSIPQLDTSKGTNLSNTFSSCTRLTKIDIKHYNISNTSYSKYTCSYCHSLKALIIRSFGANYILNSNAFNNAYHMLGIIDATYNPNGDHDGYVYVPRDMIDILSAETNWSTLQFRALEDYTLDGTTTGEFDDTKAGL